MSAKDAGWAVQRQDMVAQLKVYHITNTCVLTAMVRIRRHVFIPAAYRDANNAYKEGGRLIAPVGRGCQRLVILRKQRGRVEQEEDLPVRFVPMVRELKNCVSGSVLAPSSP